MIVYSIQCEYEHVSEAWFKDSETFQKQANSKDIECPLCGNRNITKAPMAPKVSKKSTQSQNLQKSISTMIKTVKDHVEKNCDYVGKEFASEARKIHYGEAKERGIYGEATNQECKELKEEGVKVATLPFLKTQNS